MLEHLGDLYEKLGGPPGAEAAWKRALEADPQGASAGALRQKIRRHAGAKGSRERTSAAPARDAGGPGSSLEPR